MIRKFLRLLPYVRPQWRRLVLIFLAAVALAGVSVAQPWPLKLLIDYGLGGAEAPALVAAWVGGLTAMQWVVLSAVLALAIALVGTALDAVSTWLWAETGQRMAMALAADLFDRLQRLSLRFHSRGRVGDALSRITGDAYSIYTLTESTLISPFQQLLTLGAIGVIAWQLDPRLTAVLLAVGPPLVFVAWWFGPRIRRRSARRREARSRLMSFVQQSLSAIPVLQAFCAEPRYARRFRSHADEVVGTSWRGSATEDAYKLANGMSTAVAVAAVILVGGRRVLEAGMSIGTLILFLDYSRRIMASTRTLLNTYGQLRSVEANVDRVLEVLHSDDRVPERSDPRPLPQPEDGRGSRVEFDHVSFAYEPGEPVLRQVTITVEPGETIGLVGPSGAGKTTLTSLLPRFFDPTEGAIRIDGVDIREVALRPLRQRIGIVLQQPFLMPLTVAENIAYGRWDATADEVVEAARAANANGFIRKLPDGYATRLDEHGASLSGGERQRLAIARAFLSNASIVILDEPTSALDTESELVVIDAVERLTAGRTTFIIAHRLSTAQRSDCIVVLEEGRVAEAGPHAVLMSDPASRYRRMVESQVDDQRGAEA